MKTGLFLLSLFMLDNPDIKGQEPGRNPIILSGLVFSADSLQPLPAAHFYKINKQTGGITNMEGRFRTTVERNDSVVFSFIGYKNHLFIVADTMLPGEYVIGIPLSRDTALISEVMILPRIKNLKQDLLSTSPNQDVAISNARQNLKVASAQGVAGKGIPFDADMSYEMHKRKLETKAMNKGMLGPDQLVSVNFLLVLPYMIYKLSEKNAEPVQRNVFISDKEIQAIYNRYRQKIYQTKKLPE